MISIEINHRVSILTIFVMYGVKLRTECIILEYLYIIIANVYLCNTLCLMFIYYHILIMPLVLFGWQSNNV